MFLKKVKQKLWTIVVAVAIRKDKLYELSFETLVGMTEANMTVTDVDIWHCRLGHLVKNKLIELKNLVDGMQIINTNKAEKVCEVCISGKQTKLPHN